MSHPFVEESKKKIDPAVATMIILDDLSRYTRETRDTMREMHRTLQSWNARGKAVNIDIMLTGGASAIQIDFETGETVNIDAATLNLPQTKLFGIIIYNYGPGKVRWATNESRNILDAANEIESEADARFNTHNPSIYRLNMVAPDTDARVKVTAII